MDAATIEYIRSLKPAPHADGRALVRKGMEIGRSFEAPLTWYEGYRNHMEFKKACQREGKIYWMLLMGLATMEDELAAVKKIYEFQERTGFKLGSLLHIPSGNVALPREYREHAPKTTSFVLDDLDDWLALRNAAPIDISLNDHHLVCPNSIETTVNALKAGAVRVGSFGQFLWDYPGFTDDVKRYSDMVTSLGMMMVLRGVALVLIGIFLLGVLENAMSLLNISSYYQQLVRGIVIVFVIAMDCNARKKKREDV